MGNEIFYKRKHDVQAFQVGSDRFRPDWLATLITKGAVVTYPRENSDGWKEAFGSAKVNSFYGEHIAIEGAWIVREVLGNREMITVMSDEDFKELYTPIQLIDDLKEEVLRLQKKIDHHETLKLCLDLAKDALRVAEKDIENLKIKLETVKKTIT